MLDNRVIEQVNFINDMQWQQKHSQVCKNDILIGGLRIHFCNHKKQTQNDAYRRSQRHTAHQSEKNKNKSLSHSF